MKGSTVSKKQRGLGGVHGEHVCKSTVEAFREAVGLGVVR